MVCSHTCLCVNNLQETRRGEVFYRLPDMTGMSKIKLNRMKELFQIINKN